MKNGIKWVGQEDRRGCVIAALAMITGQTYAEVKCGFSDRDLSTQGMPLMWEAFSYLAEHGYAVANKHRYYHPLRLNRDPWPPEPFADVHLCEVITTEAHAVVMLRDGAVLDPATPNPKVISDYHTVNAIAGIVELPSRRNLEAVA